MPVATTRTAAKAVPVRRATTKTATTKTASSSAAPAPPPTEEELLQILRDPATCEPKTAQHLLSILGATCASLGVCLASQEAPSTRSAAPTSSSRLASASKVSNVTKGRSICASSTSKEEAPIKAATAHSVHFSKRVVNISLTALNELLASGWKSAPPASSKTSSTSARSVGSAAASKSRDLPSAASNQSLHAVKGTPSKTLTDRNVLCLVDCFWIAVHHLWSAPPEVRKGKALEVETVAVTLTKKLVAFELVRLLKCCESGLESQR